MGRTIEQTLGELFGLQRFEENPALDATIRKTLERYPSLRSDARERETRAKAMDAWEREALCAKELAKHGDDRQVIDCFARHMLARSVADADPAKRPPFDRNTIDKGTEELKNRKRFRHMVQTHGVNALREALAAEDPQAASAALYAPDSEREAKQKDHATPEKNGPRTERQTPQKNEQDPTR